MSEGNESWDIGDLADLILGPRPQRAARDALDGAAKSESSVKPERHDQTGRETQGVIVLVNPTQDAVEAVGQYASYWSDRGEAVAVFWAGANAVKLGFFDCSGQRGWSQSLQDAVEEGRFSVVPDLLRERCQRVVVAVVTDEGWAELPLVSAAASICVIVEPAPYQLVGSYDSLRQLGTGRTPHGLSCFVTHVESAHEARLLGDRFYRLGDQFLDRAIALDGFALATHQQSSNLVAETFVQGERAAELEAVLIDVIGAAAPAVADPHGPPEHEPQVDDLAQPVCPAAPDLPRPLFIPAEHHLETESDLDHLLADSLGQLCDASANWPAFTDPVDGCCYRWIRREDGGRTLVVATLSRPAGVLEQAGACLFPGQRGDHIMVMAPVIAAETRRAAQLLDAHAQLFELSRTPQGLPSGVLLREVSSDC